jgi:cyclopropane fatty-acyl-phospholipid synthase-like methyltransferase
LGHIEERSVPGAKPLVAQPAVSPFPLPVGERVVPDATPMENPVLAEHLTRYFFARRHVNPGGRVLDAACGSGFGSSVLAERAGQVVGVDLEPEAVEYARWRYGSPRAQFQVMDCRALGFAAGVFDAYVSFETIEHLGASDHSVFVAEARRVLTDGGTFIVSTPNRDLYNLGQSPNPYHHGELSPDEFHDLLKQHFSEVALFGQRHMWLDGQAFQQLVMTNARMTALEVKLDQCLNRLDQCLSQLQQVQARFDQVQARVDEVLSVAARTDERVNRLSFTLLRSMLPARLRKMVHGRLRKQLWSSDGAQKNGHGALPEPGDVPEVGSAAPLPAVPAPAGGGAYAHSEPAPPGPQPFVLDHRAVLARTVQQIEIAAGDLERSLFLIAVCRK